MDGDDVRLHDLVDGLVIVLRQQQVLDGDETDERAVLGDVAGVDRLFVDARAADAEDGLLHGHAGAQRDILRRHDGACGILGVAQDLVDVLAHVRVRLREDAAHDICGHFLHDIHGVVDIQLVEHLAQLGVRKAADEQLLCVRLHFDERLGRQLLRQQPEQQRQAGFLQPVKDRGDIRGIHRG